METGEQESTRAPGPDLRTSWRTIELPDQGVIWMNARLTTPSVDGLMFMREAHSVYLTPKMMTTLRSIATQGRVVVPDGVSLVASGSPLTPELVTWANASGVALALECSRGMPAELERLECLDGSSSDLSWLEDMPQLKSLSLHSTSLQESSPGWALLAQKTGLEELELHAPAGRVADVAFLSSLSGLKALHLDDPAFATEHWLTINGLTSLERLSIKSSEISPDSLMLIAKNTPALSSLTLESQTLADAHVKELAGMTGLTHLRLSGHVGTMSGDGLSSLSALKGLTMVELPGGNTGGVTLRMLSELKALTYLDLSTSSLTLMDLNWVKDMIGLQGLVLDELKTGSKEDLDVLKALTNLRMLSMHEVSVSGETLREVLDQNVNLEHVRLSSVLAGDDVLEPITRMPHLRLVDLTLTQSSQQLMQALEGHGALTHLYAGVLKLDGEVVSTLMTIPTLVHVNVASTDVPGDVVQTLSGLPQLSILHLAHELDSTTWLGLFQERRLYVCEDILCGM